MKRKAPEGALHKRMRKISDMVGVIWLTMVVYIVYVEFFKHVA
jgi:hypothetical protein